MSTPTLLGYLVRQIIAPVTRKGLFSGKYILFLEYLSHAQFLYETSAVLGYVYRDRLETFAELFSEPGRQADLANSFVTLTSVADRLASLPDEPKNFFDLFFESEGKELLKSVLHIDLTHFSDFPKFRRLKIPIEYCYERLYGLTALEGIQLGSQYPELTEKLFSYKSDAEKWRRAYEAGLEIGPTPPDMPLRERQAEAKALIKPYIEKMRSDLLTKLEL